MTDQPEIPGVDSFRRYIVLLALFGAARHDATPEQFDGLRGAVELMRDEEAPLVDVVYRVFDVMGEGWDPIAVPEFGPWLHRLLLEKRRAEHPRDRRRREAREATDG